MGGPAHGPRIVPRDWRGHRRWARGRVAQLPGSASLIRTAIQHRGRVLLLRIWRDVPFPIWLRRVFLRSINPSFIVGTMALIQDERGRILLLEHTYRKELRWGLPGGWLKNTESPERGLAREVWEETGFRVEVETLLAAETFDHAQMDLIYRCRVVAGAYRGSDETGACWWAAPEELPQLMDNQTRLLQKVGVLPL